MPSWGRIDPSEYRGLPLKAHALLHDVDLHDVWRVELPGGGPGRTIEDLRRLFLARKHRERLDVATRTLFGIRHVLGKVLRWEGPRTGCGDRSFRQRLTPDDIRDSAVGVGTADGPFVVLYVYDHEALSEVCNPTVHAFSSLALVEGETGYLMYWAIYVRPVGMITPIYMGLIKPFRRWVVYPSLLKRLHEIWREEYCEGGGRKTAEV